MMKEQLLFYFHPCVTTDQTREFQVSGRYLDEVMRGLVQQRVLEKVMEGFCLAHDHGERLHVEVRTAPFLHAAVDSWRKNAGVTVHQMAKTSSKAGVKEKKQGVNQEMK